MRNAYWKFIDWQHRRAHQRLEEAREGWNKMIERRTKQIIDLDFEVSKTGGVYFQKNDTKSLPSKED